MSERRSGEVRRTGDEGPPHGRDRRNGPRDRRGSLRRRQLREVAAWACAVAGLLLAAFAINVASDANENAGRANDVSSRAAAAAAVTANAVADQAEADARANALATFNACRRANRDTRPAARAGLLVLRDLILAANRNDEPPNLPPEFREAPARLEAALARLAPTDCAKAAPDGYAVWIEEGRPAP